MSAEAEFGVMKKLSIVVPVYFNEDSLPVLFEELREIERSLLADLQMVVELIFVDDGSGDGSYEKLMDIRAERPETKIIKLTRNFGAVHASKTGLRYVTGDCFLVLAADLQDPPELISELVRRWLDGSKFVIAARQSRHDPWASRLASWVYYRLVRLFVIPGFPREGYDLALMDDSMRTHLTKSSKNLNTPLFAYWLGFHPDLIYYERRERPFGRSRWTLAKRVKFLLDSILGFSIVPIRAMSALGILVAFASFLYASVIVINALIGRSSVPGFPTIGALLAFSQGLVMIMLGIIGEYLWRVFDQVNHRPETVVEEVHL